jgi:hypothetical protein
VNASGELPNASRARPEPPPKIFDNGVTGVTGVVPVGSHELLVAPSNPTPLPQTDTGRTSTGVPVVGVVLAVVTPHDAFAVPSPPTPLPQTVNGADRVTGVPVVPGTVPAVVPGVLPVLDVAAGPPHPAAAFPTALPHTVVGASIAASTPLPEVAAPEEVALELAGAELPPLDSGEPDEHDDDARPSTPTEFPQAVRGAAAAASTPSPEEVADVEPGPAAGAAELSPRTATELPVTVMGAAAASPTPLPELDEVAAPPPVLAGTVLVPRIEMEFPLTFTGADTAAGRPFPVAVLDVVWADAIPAPITQNPPIRTAP